MGWKVRRNRAQPMPEVDPSLDLPERTIVRGINKYNDWHWGIDPVRVKDGKDDDMPPVLIQCGLFVRAHVRAPQDKHPRRHRDTVITLSRKAASTSHLAYDPDHPDERLYILLEPAARMDLKRRFWDRNRMRPLNLNRVALAAGGRHGKRADYPNIMVKPIGVFTAVVYYTNKKGDGPSNYIHHLGEVSGVMPILCVDRRGRLWVAGGSYTCPTPGITD